MSPDAVRLRGVTWGHARGFLPLVAGCAAWEDRTGGVVQVSWEVRSLWEFGEAGLSGVADAYDLLVIDHPLVGDAVEDRLLLDLGSLDPDADAVGPSQASYRHGTCTWALAVDAACQVAAWRPDLLGDHPPPTTLAEVSALPADVPVAMAMAPVDLLTVWLGLCASLGEEPLRRPDVAVDRDTGSEALALLCLLVERCGRQWLGRNPIDVLRRMTATDEVAYVPFTYGYSNYARPGFSRRPLAFGASPGPAGGPGRTTLGGAGVAVSSRSTQASAAVDVARWLASRDCQAGPYLEAGGQPAHRSAWTSALAQALAGDFFPSTLPAVESAYVRPTRRGMTAFQRGCGELLEAGLRQGVPDRRLLDEVDAAWRGTTAS